MVLITNLVSEFYNRISRTRLLLIAAVDLDAVCSAKILQSVFKADHVEYTLIPVSSKDEMRLAYEDHRHTVKNVLLVGCGGCLEVLNYMDPEEDTVFYIIDSQRPLNIENVYNKDQVNVLVFQKESFDIPQFEDIFGSDSEEEQLDDAHDSGDESDYGRRSETKEKFKTKRARHLWRRKREALLSDYTRQSYHGAAGSLVAYELAKRLARENNDILWWTIISVTERYLLGRSGKLVYNTFIQYLQEERTRLDHCDDVVTRSVNSLKIISEEELNLVLYRHWNLYDSIFNSSYTSSKLRLWTIQGQKKLHELFADMGLPLVQCKQKFTSMSVQFKAGLKEHFVQSSKKFGVTSLTYPSFSATFGYRHKLSAADFVFSLLALLEKQDIESSAGFMGALDALSRTNFEVIYSGLELAIHQQLAISGQIKGFVNTYRVVSTGPFIFAQLEEGVPDVKMFENPLALRRLGRQLMETWIVVTRKTRAQKVPYVISAPLSRRPGYCLLVAVSAYNDEESKCEISRAFDIAATKLQLSVEFNYFDDTVIEIKKLDQNRFLDAMAALMMT